MDTVKNRLMRTLIFISLLALTSNAVVKVEQTKYIKDPQLVDCYGNPIDGGLTNSVMTIMVDKYVDRACYIEVKPSAADIALAENSKVVAGLMNVDDIDNVIGNEGDSATGGLKGACAELIASGDPVAVSNAGQVADTQDRVMGGAAAQNISLGLCSMVYSAEDTIAVGNGDGVLPDATYGLSFRFVDLFAAGTVANANHFGNGWDQPDGAQNHVLLFADQLANNTAGNEHWALGKTQGPADTSFATYWATEHAIKITIKQMPSITDQLSAMNLASVPLLPTPSKHKA